MTVTVTHVYEDYSQAEEVVEDLLGVGFTMDEISAVGRKLQNGAENDTGDGAATAATLGGAAGAAAGLLASLGLIAIPGIGPVLTTGIIATTLAGAATGAVAGGLLGALVEYGISEEDALVYAESIRRGGGLVSVRTDESTADKAEAIMQKHGPVDIGERGNAYRTKGWKTHDPNAPVYTDGDRQR